MTKPDRKAYRFLTNDQWRAGARQGLALEDGALHVADALCVVPVDGTSGDGGSLAAWDACGRMIWLRPSGELLRRYSFGIEMVHWLDRADVTRQIVHNGGLLWRLAAGRVERIGMSSFVRLGEVGPTRGWSISAIAPDTCTGLWLAENTNRQSRLRHVDCWGHSCLDDIALSMPMGAHVVIASSADGLRVAALGSTATETMLMIVNTVTRNVVGVRLGADHARGPTHVAIHHEQVHVVTATSDTSVLIEVFGVEGQVEDRQTLEVPVSVGAIGGVISGPELLLTGSNGLATLEICVGADVLRTGTFITPALFSAEVQAARWNRTELDAVLPPGTGIEVAWASTDDLHLISKANALFAGPATASLVDDLNALLPWTSEQTVRYDASGDFDLTPERLAALLDGVAEGTIWIRVRLETPGGRTPGSLHSLHVLYPHESYLDDLPAVYREDPKASAQLRTILAPIELQYDGIDQALASLPDRIDPRTAPDVWTPTLLSWLGFPLLGDLSARLRRTLLENAPTLLTCRGTLDALRRMLDIVTDGRATVHDSADGPSAWILPVAGVAQPARLGASSVLSAQQPAPAQPGTMVLGETPVGHGCADPTLVLAQKSRIVTIRFDLDDDDRRVLEPVLDRLLRYFVPAHCRLDIVYSAIDGRDLSAQLNLDFRLGGDDGEPAGQLYSDAHWQLGANARLGHWRLAEPPITPARLDHNVLTTSNARLN